MSGDNQSLFRVVDSKELRLFRYNPIDDETLAIVGKIIRDTANRGEKALREYAMRYGDLEDGGALLIDRREFERYVKQVDSSTISLLERTATRIRDFATKQLRCVTELATTIDSAKAGHRLIPLNTVACYCPGGRYPLLSTVLMTAIPARVAGVAKVIVASPKPSAEMITAAAMAGADCVLTIGGAQAIAGMAYGTGQIPECDLIVGPGNRWVSAAKQILYGTVAIDMIAGPSELVVFADGTADPNILALDLLAQAEHDSDAMPVLVSLSSELTTEVCISLDKLLDEHPSSVAESALKNGFAVNVDDIAEGIAICNKIAPEHLELNLKDTEAIVPKLKNYGALFIGEKSAEVFGDYGAGPNHVLPTSGTARFASGLSVMNYLRQATWLEMSDNEQSTSIAQDAADFAELEGLYWHQLAAKARIR